MNTFMYMTRIMCPSSFYTSDLSSLLNSKSDIRECRQWGHNPCTQEVYRRGQTKQGRKKKEVEYKSFPEVLNINTNF